ncbi:hypothetical protein [Nostoc sp. CHAB 5715]|uniref:hypothetical protein n=1 Tax=Nostoc sp. CHAB 5715 TaxID=2780400 RepID=UPI001E344C77|nr:hypothetical protein [Nostoc sp. CHAB 5715]MCC5626183.1 hypothetical protein [Nostoc sp. CHAB 5715]
MFQYKLRSHFSPTPHNCDRTSPLHSPQLRSQFPSRKLRRDRKTKPPSPLQAGRFYS